MRQKMRLDKDIKKGILTILESSEVDPGIVMPLHEESYPLEEVTQAYKQGYDAFAGSIRRRSFFPIKDVMIKLFESSADFFKNKSADKLIVEYDDADSFPKEEFHLEEEDVEIDKILEEDGDTKEDEIKEIDSEDDTPKFKPEDNSEHEN
ncbi:MAG: hypothetical protein GY729_01795 [Desulfobacteraceae bacterium]|nr:hypothetical protein [Desulfobacteraceae bacterium]